MSHWTDALSYKEVEGTLTCVDVLRSVPWAASLLATTKSIVDKLLVGLADREAYSNNPVSAAEKSFLFELRFAAALATAGIGATYEHGAGVGDTTVDFLVHLEPRPWLVELVSLHESDAFKAATWDNVETDASGATVSTFGFALGLDMDEPKQSEEGETLKAQERIGTKVFDTKSKKPVKFPAPGPAVNMLMVDARGFLGSGMGDKADWHQIVHGAKGLSPELVKLWKDPRTGKEEPILGLLERGCPLASATFVRERLQVIAFVCEKDFNLGELRERTFMLCNPALFESEGAAREAIASWPLRG